MVAFLRAIGGRLFEFESTVSDWPTVRFSCRDDAPKAVSSQWHVMEQRGTEHFDGKRLHADAAPSGSERMATRT